MSSGNLSLIDMKGVSEPLIKLIESVSKGIGAIYEPIGKVRNAKAEAKAMLILAEAEGKANAILARACERINFREIRRQNNIDAIVKGAAEALPEKVSPEPVNEDWIANFFGLSQDIGDVEMQQIWSKLLAGEVSQPGTFKPRTLQAVKNLTQEEAKMFTTLCTFSFSAAISGNVLPIFSYEFFKYIRSNGLSSHAETHLKNVGLLSATNLVRGIDEKVIELKYFSKYYYIAFPHDGKNEFNYFPFTEIGNELASIAGSVPDESYIKCLVENCDLKINT